MMGRSASAGTAVLFDDEVVSVERSLIRMCNSLLLATSLLMLQKKVYRRPTLASEYMWGRRVYLGVSAQNYIIDLRKQSPFPASILRNFLCQWQDHALTIQCDSGCPTMRYFSVKIGRKALLQPLQ
jgi:hypothetical protein